MRYKKVGKSGVDMSVLTIGTWAMGGLGYGSVERGDCIDAVRAMVEQGVNHIDTAWVYGLGESDKVVSETKCLLLRRQALEIQQMEKVVTFRIVHRNGSQNALKNLLEILEQTM